MKRRFILAACASILALFSCYTFVIADESNPTIHLRIEGDSKTVYDDEVSIGDCTVNGKNFSKAAACAVVNAGQEKGLEYEFTSWGDDLFLSRIGNDVNPADYSKSWAFWINDNESQIGLGAYTVKDKDDILLSFASYPSIPTRLTAPKTAVVGEPITILAEKSGLYDGWVWQGGWTPAANATITFGDVSESTNEEGKITRTFTTPGIVSLQASGAGYVRSIPIEITVTTKPSETPTPTATPESTPTATASPTPTITPTASPTATPVVVANTSDEERHEAAHKALSYLRNKQEDSGFIDSASPTAWSAIAFGAAEKRASQISQNDSLLKALANSDVSSATDIERHIMAIRAAGENPRSFNDTNYVSKLKEYYRDHQFGETSLINDDIFGVLALLAVDESTSSSEMHNTILTIKDKQQDNGSWQNSLDLTAAAIQALKAYQLSDGKVDVDDALHQARSYLRSYQDDKGGFGSNSATTSWCIQALLALGEDVSSWDVDSHTPWSALLSYQNSNGGFGWQNDDDSSVLMTAYAIPALLDSPWPITKLDISTTTESFAEETPTPAPTAKPSTKTIATTASQPIATPNPSVAGIIERRTSIAVTPEPQTPSPSPASQNISTDSTPNTSQPSGQPFALSLFGLAHLSIGVSMARLFNKLML